MLKICPATQLASAAAGGWWEIRTFSGRTATHTVSPGPAPFAPAARSLPASGLMMVAIVALDPSGSVTRPSIRFTSPMKSATHLQLGCS
jgi:hypothetical protein